MVRNRKREIFSGEPLGAQVSTEAGATVRGKPSDGSEWSVARASLTLTETDRHPLGKAYHRQRKHTVWGAQL